LGWVFLGIGLVLLAGCGWAYQFQPQWVVQVSDLLGRSSAIVAVQDDKSDGEFAALYQRYRMTPLGTRAAGTSKVNSLLVSLQQEPCHKQAIF
jgi:hypothetical protein